MKSILELIDLDVLCEALYITDKEPLKILDYGCGDGTLLAALHGRVQPETMLFGFDISSDAVAAAKAKNIPNSEFYSGPAEEQLPIILKTADVCIMSRVFHEIVEQKRVKIIMKEIHRVVQSFGKVGIIEFKKNAKIDFGPPMSARLTPGGVERLLITEGFRHKDVIDLGPYMYLTTFELTGRADLFGNG